jgi:ABC-type amino acid transport substrate-binding protein
MPRTFLFLINLLFSALLFADPWVFGTTYYNPPFEMAANNSTTLTGFDVELIKELCTRINQSCSFKVYTFEQLFPALLNKEINGIIAGVTITAARNETFLFSLPYMASSGRFMVKSTSVCKDLDSLNGLRIGIERGSLFKSFALKTLGAKTNVTEYKTQADLLQALGNDNIDAGLLDAATAEYWVANNNDMFKLIGNNIPVGLGYGIMANKDNNTLINNINHALLSMENDGAYLRLYNLYFETLT